MIDGATYFAWFVIALLFFAAVAFVVWIGSVPKKIASRRNHPQVDAINAASWLGLALGGVGWPIAFVWAFLRSGQAGSESDSSRSQLQEEIDRLRNQISELKGQLKVQPTEKDSK